MRYHKCIRNSYGQTIYIASTGSGTAGDLAGTILTSGAMTLTAGGAGTVARSIRKRIDNQMMTDEKDTCPSCGCVCPCECKDCDCCASGS